MKKAILLLSSVILLLMAGCGNADETVENNDKDQIDTSKSEEENQDSEEVKDQEAKEEDPESILDTYYSARQAKDYQAMGPYLSEKNFTFSNVSKEEFLKQMEENDYVDHVEVAEFKISQFKDVDENIKYAEVLSKGKVNGEESSAKDILYMIKEDGQWKIDYTGVSSSDQFETVSNDISEFSEIELLNLYNHDKQLLFKWDNKMTDNGISIGWADNATATLKTDKDEYKASLQIEELEAGASFDQYRIYFEAADGEPESVTISGLYVLEKKGLPDPSQDPLDITIDLK